MDMLWNLAWLIVGACLGAIVMAVFAISGDEDKDNDAR